jgi:uncharacterized protein (TIGR02569 family)
MPSPPESVLRAFGAQGEPARLTGGRVTAWRVGEVVLKPLDMSVPELEWQARVLSEIAGDDVRVAPPLRSRCGALVVDGWTGWPYLDGRHAPRWTEVIDAGQRLHAALVTVPRPSHLFDARLHHWARADRVAWGEASDPEIPAGSDLAWLLKARRPIPLPGQLIHGDLSGNVLLADGQPPAVIDFSPYWRPKEYATAIVLVDAVVWHDADPQLLELLLPRDDETQLLIRAAIFRLLSDSDPAAGRRTLRPARQSSARSRPPSVNRLPLPRRPRVPQPMELASLASAFDLRPERSGRSLSNPDGSDGRWQRKICI